MDDAELARKIVEQCPHEWVINVLKALNTIQTAEYTRCLLNVALGTVSEEDEHMFGRMVRYLLTDPVRSQVESVVGVIPRTYVEYTRDVLRDALRRMNVPGCSKLSVPELQTWVGRIQVLQPGLLDTVKDQRTTQGRTKRARTYSEALHNLHTLQPGDVVTWGSAVQSYGIVRDLSDQRVRVDKVDTYGKYVTRYGLWVPGKDVKKVEVPRETLS